MNEIINVLKSECKRQSDWVKSRHNSFANWLRKNSYYTMMPKDYIIPKPMLDKYVKWYKVLFVIGFIIAMI